MKCIKQILLVVSLTVAMGSVAQIRVAQQPTYPTAGVSTEQNFSADLALPKVNAPSPFNSHQGAVTPQQVYSPSTAGASYNAAELQRVSAGKVVSVGGGAGASGGVVVSGGAVSSGESASSGAVSSFIVAPIVVRKHRNFVSADEVLTINETADEAVKRGLPTFPNKGEGEGGANDTNRYGPITDTPWLLMLLACAAFIGYKIRMRRKVS